MLAPTRVEAQATAGSAAGPEPLIRVGGGGDAHWVELAPPLRRDHSAVYDPVGDRMLVFGGASASAPGSSTGILWALGLGTGERWAQVDASGTAPGGGLAVWDPLRGQLLVGAGSSVWSLQFRGRPNWSPLRTTGSPPDYHALLFDSARDRLLALSERLEVWQLPMSGPLRWTPLPTSGAPAVMRSGFSTVLDVVQDRILVYGGHIPQPPPCDQRISAVNEVWGLPLGSGSAWQQLPAPTGPAADEHSAVFDPVRNRMIVFGGHQWRRTCDPIATDCNTGCYDDLLFLRTGCWALSLSPDLAWTQIAASGEPSDRAGHSAIYDPVRDRMVIYGGWFQNCSECANDIPSDYSDATALALGGRPEWQMVASGAPPTRIGGSIAVYDPSRERMIVYGGSGDSPYFGSFGISDRVDYQLASDTPTALGRVGGPVRIGPSIVVDPNRNRLVLFGGYDKTYVGYPGNDTNDTWAASLSADGPWEQVATTGTPPAPRSGHTAVFDPVADQMLVCGGLDESLQAHTPLWSLRFGDTPNWAAVLAQSPFVLRGYPTSVLDADGRRLIFFGDQGGQDVWSVSLDPGATWTRLATAGSGPDPGSIEAILDSPRRRVIVNRQWALSLEPRPVWTRLRVQGIGPDYGAAVFDPARDRLVVCTDGGASFWALRFAPERPSPIHRLQDPPARIFLSEPLPNPTRGSTSFVLQVAEPTEVSVGVFDMQGRRVATLANGVLESGTHRLSWDGRAAGGGGAPPGLYFLRSRTANQTSVRRLLVLR